MGNGPTFLRRDACSAASLAALAGSLSSMKSGGGVFLAAAKSAKLREEHRIEDEAKR